MSHAHRRRRRGIMHFEHKDEPLASPAELRRRLARSGALAALVIGFSLAIGILGYHYLCHIPGWVDDLYNASMILGGMGPVAEVTSPVGKVFASFYALYSGVMLLASVGLLLSPLIHRLLHRFHVATDEDDR